jgi:hypothetical protein
MEVVYQRCAGVDVHQRFLVVCLSMIEGGSDAKRFAVSATRRWIYWRDKHG